MKKSIWFLLTFFVLAVGCLSLSLYGYWTDNLDAQLTLSVVHPAEISISEETVPAADIPSISDPVPETTKAGEPEDLNPESEPADTEEVDLETTAAEETDLETTAAEETDLETTADDQTAEPETEIIKTDVGETE